MEEVTEDSANGTISCSSGIFPDEDWGRTNFPVTGTGRALLEFSSVSRKTTQYSQMIQMASGLKKALK